MPQPIGYSILTDDDNLTSSGELYDYTWAGNGVFIEAENALIKACIPISTSPTRGLHDLSPEVILKHGRIEERYLHYIVQEMVRNPEGEDYYAIVWEDNQYKIRKPNQIKTDVSVVYEQLPNVVLDIHSHPGNKYLAFSSQDDKDEQGLKIYGVIGGLGRRQPLAMARVGVYGYFHYLEWSEIFAVGPEHYDCVEWSFELWSEDKEIVANMRDYWKHLGKED